MFEYTRFAVKQTVDDLKSLKHIIDVSTQVIYIAYLVVALIVPLGFVYANAILLALSVAYFAFYLSRYDSTTKELKEAGSREVAAIYKGLKLTVGAVTLGIVFYGVYVAASKATPFAVMSAIAMAVAWILKVIIEIAVYVVSARVDMFVSAIEADVEKLVKPVQTIGNIFKKATGQEIEEPKAHSKQRILLEAKVAAEREKRRNQLIEEKEKRAAEKRERYEIERQIKDAKRLEKIEAKRARSAARAGGNTQEPEREELNPETAPLMKSEE